MEALRELTTGVILNPQYAEFLALIKAARNGAVYGAKVRFPHALVMIFLFRSGTVRSKIALVLKATRTHARNLATFAVIYKAMMLVLRHSAPLSSSPRKEASYDTLLAGLIGGYTVFGRGIQSSVNQQIVIYVFARVVLGLAKLSVSTDMLGPLEVRDRLAKNAWPVFAAASWATVMWLFRWHPETLQPSLRSSMVYIYQDSDVWNSVKNFLVVNR